MDPDDFFSILTSIDPNDFVWGLAVTVFLVSAVVTVPIMIIHKKFLSGEARRRRCPNCRKWNVGELQTKEALKQVTQRRSDPGGVYTVLISTYEGTYTCKDCGHTWERTWKEEERAR